MLSLQSPRVLRLADAASVATAAITRIAARVSERPNCVLGLATGRTPLAVYDGLAQCVADGRLSFAGVETFNLDEYLDLPAGHPSSFRAYMAERFFRRVDIDPAKTHVPSGEGRPGDGDRYEAAIRSAGGIDLQMLGIGQNGHIGFNEPGTSFDSRTHVVTLTQATRDANTADFPNGERPPPRALTMGIATILEAREIILLATGTHKADALARAFGASPDTSCPAAALRFHPRVTVICDEEAAPKGSVLANHR